MVHADRMLALLRERRVVDDPGLDRPVFLDRRQHHLAHLGQHLLIRPGRDADKMQQRLMLRRRPRWSCPRRHRFDALALTRQHQTGAIIAQRPSPVRVANDARKPFNIGRKPRFAVADILDIHLALHLPKSESLQVVDSRPQRLRPSDSVRLTHPTHRSNSAPQCPSNAISVRTGTSMARSFAAPPRSGRSMMKQAATTLAPIWRSSFTAPSAVPPVAMRSSTRITRSPGWTASACISISSRPYSSE